MLHNFLSRPLSFLGWITAMLFLLDFHHAKSNLYKWFRMQRHDWSSTSPKEPTSHLSLSPCTGYRLRLASSSRHWCLHIQVEQPPSYFHSLLRIYIPSRSPRSTSERHLVVHHREAQNHFPEHFRSPFLASGITFPPLSGMMIPWQFSSDWRDRKLLKNKQTNFVFSFL